MADKTFRKIAYMKRKNISLTTDNVSDKARKLIEIAEAEENLVLKLSINSPVYIEDAEFLTAEGIKKITT